MKKLFTLALISFSVQAIGQIRNHVDVSVTYTSSVYMDKLSSDSRTSEGIPVPTVLGNVKGSSGYRASILYSNLSFKYQPGIVFGHKDYQLGTELTKMFDGPVSFSSTTIGITNKYNFLNYGQFKIVPYLKGNLLCNITRFEAPATSFVVTEETQDANTTYEATIETDAVNESSVVPSFELVAGAESKLHDKVFLILEFSLALSKYPDLDMSNSPPIHKEVCMLIGLQYKLAKNKRFYK